MTDTVDMWADETEAERAERHAREDARGRVFSEGILGLLNDKLDAEFGDGRTEPYLRKSARTDPVVVRRIRLELDSLPAGEELWIRHYETSPASGPTSTRLRAYLGDDYYVRRRKGDVYARRRQPDEPILRNDRVKLGAEWMTARGAAEAIGVSECYLRLTWYGTEQLPKFEFGRRRVVRRIDVDAIIEERRRAGRYRPGGAALREPMLEEYDPSEVYVSQVSTDHITGPSS